MRQFVRLAGLVVVLGFAACSSSDSGGTNGTGGAGGSAGGTSTGGTGGSGGLSGAGGTSGTGGAAAYGGSSGTSGSAGMTSVDAATDAPKCGVIRASDYDQTCTADSDCTFAWEGDSCTAECSCPNATISKTAVAEYFSHYPALFPQRIACPCVFPGQLTCVSGVCTTCPPAGCPAKDGGTTSVEAGSDGSTASDVGAADAGLGSECSALTDALHLAVGHAIACTQHDDCDATSTVLDECNCLLPTNRTLPTETQEARTAYQAWVVAGCTPHCDLRSCFTNVYGVGCSYPEGACFWPPPL